MKKLFAAITIGMFVFQSCTKENAIAPQKFQTERKAEATSAPMKILIIRCGTDDPTKNPKTRANIQVGQTPPIYVQDIITE